MKRQKPTHGSDLIASMGWRAGDMELRYTDGAIFVYSDVSLGLFESLKRAAHPGETWLKIRHAYDFKRID